MAVVISNGSHTKGKTYLAFSKDGERCYTGGVDCTIRIWRMNGVEEEEPVTASEADKEITSIATSHDYWLTASEDSEVRRYVLDKPQFDALVTAANAVAVRCIAIDSRGASVAVASDELNVKVVNMEDPLKISILQGHQAGVRKASWHPTEQLLATSGSDGKIIIWNLANDEVKIEKIFEDVIPKVTDDRAPDFGHDCSVVWHPSGARFYVATRTHEIAVYSRANWSKITSFVNPDVSGAITALAISPNGLYIASAARSQISTWSDKHNLINKQLGKPGYVINQIEFSPKDNLIAWTDESGSFGRWHDAIPSELPDPMKRTLASSKSAQIDPLDIFNDDILDETRPADEFDQDDDDDAIPIDDELPEDFIDDDTGKGLQEDAVYDKDFVKEMVSITKAQPPFQPGSTPMEGNKRYLAYNMIGVIEATDQDTHQIITVEFFDRSARSGFNFTDRLKYTLGYLGERGALFACPPQDEHPAQVLYRPYAPRQAEIEWSYILKKRAGTSVRVLGIAAGGLPPLKSLREESDEFQGFGNVVVATSEGGLTFLSGTGMERRIMGLGADFVSMVAGPEWVFVVHRAGSTTIDGSQNLSYSLIYFEDFTIRQHGVLPVPKGHLLKWIGITEQGAPAMYDTTGRLHILTKFRIAYHATWARVLDTELLERKQGKDESYWPVGVAADAFMCLILKGRQEHPRFPRPLIQEIPMQMPFRNPEPLEERTARQALHLEMAMDSLDDELTSQDVITRERSMDKEFLLLIQAACKVGNTARALELAKLIHHDPAMNASIKMADFFHLSGLKEKLTILRNSRQEKEDRYTEAREKRRRWNKSEPALRHLPEQQQAESRPKPFQDFGPPPTIPRPGLSRATPAVETTRFSSMAPESDLSATWEEIPVEPSPSGSTQKRKRDEVEDTSFSDFASPLPPSATKTKANPFARKAPSDANRNPFARKAETNKVLQKSESFFEKVDAADIDLVKPKRLKSKEKEKEKEKEVKKDGPRQTTLFGLPASDKKTTMKAPKLKKSLLGESQNGLESETQLLSAAGDPETQVEESMTMQGLEETQIVDGESQMDE
ncbi:hypothetical protein C8J56DRAFT_378653 [Mycena floridula]|nr:hypothetical protein C8J56DRAFT_378653 [Mycena floridula]